MADIILGCDLNRPSADRQHQKIIANMFEKQGHTVKILAVGPGATQTEMRKKSSKGKIAIFLVNGACIGTYKDFWWGMHKGYYHTKYCYFGLQGYAHKKTMTCSAAKTYKLPKAHDDRSSVSFTKELVGMTTHEVMEKYKEKIYYACGNSVEELGNNLLQVISGGNPTSSGSSGSQNFGSIKEALTDVLYGWDGEVECYLRDDTVHIRKIKSPTTATLKLIEGENVYLDSVSVTDVNPSSINHISSDFKDYHLSISDDDRIERFGKISKKIVMGSGIKTLDKAKAFLQREWVKTKRDNGHVLECSVMGDAKWKNGWCRVYLPSFNIDDYMYITKVSQSDSSYGWDCQLTLVDYPPGFGEPANQNNQNNTTQNNAKEDTSNTQDNQDTMDEEELISDIQ